MVSLVVTLNLLCVTDILDDALIAAVSDMFSDALSNICVIDSILLSLLNLHPEKLQIITAKTKAAAPQNSKDVRMGYLRKLTLSFLPRRFENSIVDLVPLLSPSQKQMTRSALITISLFLIMPADLP